MGRNLRGARSFGDGGIDPDNSDIRKTSKGSQTRNDSAPRLNLVIRSWLSARRTFIDDALEEKLNRARHYSRGARFSCCRGIGRSRRGPRRILRRTVARRVSAIPAKGHFPVAVEVTPSTIETVSVRARSILVGPYLPRGRNRPEVCHQRFLATVGAPFDPGHLGLYRSELCNRSRLTTHPHGHWKAILERPAWRGTLP